MEHVLISRHRVSGEMMDIVHFSMFGSSIPSHTPTATIDNRPTDKGLETRNFFGNFPFRCALRSRDIEMVLVSCSEHLQEL